MNPVATGRLSRHFAVRALACFALSVACALAAGCGGSKHASENARTASAGAGSDPVTAVTAGADSGIVPQPPGAPGTPVGEPGAVLFAKRCALCHGADGHGDGVASKGLNPKPRNFHDETYMSTRTDAQLLEVIHKGKGVMPRWEGQLSEAEIRAVLAHIRKLGGKR